MPSIESSRKLVRKATKGVAQTEWFIKEVNEKVNATMQQRMGIVVGFLRAKTILNIKKPVVRSIGPRGGMVVERSSPGEFPRADTTQLLQTLVTDVINVSPGIIDGIVGSPQSYSIPLEKDLDRRFLSRTLEEELGNVRKILLGDSISFTQF